MKKLVLLLTTLLFLSILVSSPVLAARPLSDYRIHSIFGVLYRSYFLFKGIVIVPDGNTPMDDDGGVGTLLGGDADDYGNGRGGDDDDTKLSNNLIGVSSSGSCGIGPSDRKSVE